MKAKIGAEDRKHPSFDFEPAKSSQRILIQDWLAQEHIKKWIHRVGLQNTLNGLEKFFQRESSTTYRIAYDHIVSFAFLITSPERSELPP